VMDVLEGLTDGSVDRLGGANRFETAVAVSEATFVRSDTVYLVRGTDFPDALAVGPAAGASASPVLLSPRTCVPVTVWDEIQRLEAERVVLAGGPAALGPGVEHVVACGQEATVVAQGLQVPWDVAFTPDGRTFVTERDTGRVLELDDGQTSVAHTFTVNNAGEGGLLGLTVSPDYESDGWLYAYYTTGTDNRVVRFRPGGQVQNVVTGIPRANIHNGGRIAFGPDGMLYISTGDAANPALSQNPESLAGKILRVRPGGGVPDDNPVPGSRVYALGLRNSQGLAWDAEGRLYATEFGPACDDEINLIEAGRNYGWPDGCGETRAGAVPPLVVKQPPEASWSAISSSRSALPPNWPGPHSPAGPVASSMAAIRSALTVRSWPPSSDRYR
jgi:glucose/arabinose dehydrogenase